jgi:hypothetical protein
MGVFQWIGVPDAFMKGSILLLAVFLVTTRAREIVIKKHFLFLYAGCLLIFFSSKSLADFVEYSPPVFMLLVAIHLTPLFEKIPSDRFTKVFMNLIKLSLIGTLLKLVIFGIDESYLVGLMTMTAGELGLMFPGFMIVFYLHMYKGQKSSNWLLLYLFLFAIINEKRSIVFVFPVLFMILGEIKLKHALLFVAFLYPLAISLIPSLNKEEKVFGSVDLIYPFSYAIDYVMADYGAGLQGSKEEAYKDKNVQMGRVTLMLKLRKEYEQMDVQKALFGAGIGRYTNKYNSSKGIEDNLFKDYGYRGNLSSFLQLTLESGILSFVLIFLFIYKQLRYYLKGRVFYAILFLYVYDMFFYGQTALKILPISIYIFTIIPLIYESTRTTYSTVQK